MADIAHVIAVAIGVLFIGSSLAKLLALDSDLSRFMVSLLLTQPIHSAMHACMP